MGFVAGIGGGMGVEVGFFEKNIYSVRMNKRNSQKKFKGEILMMQNDLMSKLASIEQPAKPIDDLGFGRYAPEETPDALVNLISRSKEVVSVG